MKIFTCTLNRCICKKAPNKTALIPVSGMPNLDLKGDIVDVPVFLKLDINAGSIHPYLMAGPTVGFIVNSTLEIAGAGSEFKGDADDIIKTLDLVSGLAVA